ncbi:OmpA-OmpF porin, OOP family [Paucidesulfovibrio gracilis DSM 16080]|uniref:OmpA-OmpF porin, OOP family n=1 Tax=Paucidesulfovibrio gracilis DSM 16080 TaxID=1121449 RepID=A0A1T4X3V3_9BACT|nr:OmpA family protein [Paucidesulfovibrio gracilis]SKA83551.1 OmpA-OmpF porin, OOP family [Paucidesulfovibrio gracilis DSM 16080]
MVNMKRSGLGICLVVLALMMAFSTAAFAGKKVPKVDNFILFVDHSGSMAQKYMGSGAKKIDLAKGMMGKLNDAIPELGYSGAVYTFAPFAGYAQPAPYSTAEVGQAINGLDTDYEVFMRRTPMGNGLIDLDSVLAGLDGKTAVIMVTDGASNIGADPVAQAQALYAKYGGKVCFHVISYADTEKGRMIIDEIRALNSCSVPADGEALMADAAVMDKFVEDVFFTEAAEPQPVDETIVFRLNFDFDKSNIKEDMVPILEQALILLQEKPDMDYVVEGWTDSIGTDAYNMGLSKRRADSVTQWLTGNGINSSRLEPVGKGESVKFDNSTDEGRYQNRRVEIRSK